MRYSQQGENVEMTRSSAAVISFILIVLTGSFALAQDSTPKVQVFGGYSFVLADPGKLRGGNLDLFLRQNFDAFGTGSSFSGWSTEAQYNADRWFGVAVDFGGRYGTPITPYSRSSVSGVPKATAYSVLVGPVLSYRTKSRITPFVHALFGWDRTSLGASTISGVSTPVSSVAITYDDFAMALGIGIDYRISRHFAIRAGQIDYFHTSLNLDSFYRNAFDNQLFQGLANHQDNLRFSAGAVLRF
jgi:opacity protein-like surface antigen